MPRWMSSLSGFCGRLSTVYYLLNNNLTVGGQGIYWKCFGLGWGSSWLYLAGCEVQVLHYRDAKPAAYISTVGAKNLVLHGLLVWHAV